MIMIELNTKGYSMYTLVVECILMLTTNHFDDEGPAAVALICNVYGEDKWVEGHCKRKLRNSTSQASIHYNYGEMRHPVRIYFSLRMKRKQTVDNTVHDEL